MFESPAELDDLQQLLDRSLSGSTSHLRSIVTPERSAVTAAQLTAALTDMCVLSVATVTARGEPRISALDGHFWHGRWVFGTDRSAAKARQLAARPAASVAHVRGEALGVFAHGVAEVVYPTASPHDDWTAIHEHLTQHYGESPLGFGDVVYYRLRPHWMVAYAPDPAALLARPTTDGGMS